MQQGHSSALALQSPSLWQRFGAGLQDGAARGGTGMRGGTVATLSHCPGQGGAGALQQQGNVILCGAWQ